MKKAGEWVLSQRGAGTYSRSLKVAHITDTHLFADRTGNLLGINTQESFRQVLDFLRYEGPFDLALATGDLVHDASAAGYRRFCETVAQLGCPVYCLPGNHDERAALARHVRHPLVSAPRLVDVGDWRFVLLDSTIPGQAGGRISHSELAFLEQALRDNERPVLICLHHQPVPMGSTWIDVMAVENGPEFLAILDTTPQVKGVIWGHVHQEFCRDHGKIRLMATPSTCVQFSPRSADFKVDSRPPGCRILELLADGSLDSRVLRLHDTPQGLQVGSPGY